MTRLRALSRSIRGRIIIGYALVVVLVVAIWAWSLFGPLTQAAVDQQRTDLITVARVAVLSIDGQPASVAARRIAAVAGSDLRVTIVGADGTVLADSAEDPASMRNHAERPEVAAALHGQVGSATRRSATLGTNQMYVALPATLAGDPVVLRVSEPLALVEGLADKGRQTGLALLVMALAAAVAVAYRLSGAASAPVVRIRDAAESMASGNLSAPIPVLEGELGDLARALEALRDRARATIEDLERNEALLRTALDGLTDTVLLVEGDTVAFANRAASTAFRAPAAGWIGARLAEIGLPASLAETVRTGMLSERASARDVGPDPEGRYHRITVVPLGASEAGTRTLVVISDTSASNRFDAMRRDFVANASHELKTPVAAIKLLAEAAEAASSDGDTQQSRVFIMQLREETERLRRLVADLLDLSRLEHGAHGDEITDMRAAIENALAGHRPAATAAGLALVFDTADCACEDVYVSAGGTDVAVTLDNLLANAVAYTEEGAVTVRLAADADWVTTTVSDTGPGIAPDQLPRIFERFYRVDAARSRATGGTGLGLALARNAIEASGGIIEVDSTLGAGTTFTVRLPRAS